MNITVSGHQVNLGSSLQSYVTERLESVVFRYFANAISANVVFSKESYLYNCDIIVNDGTGRKLVMKSSDSSDDIYSSFDSSLLKLEKQLRRYKSKINNKSSRVRTVEAIESIAAMKYVISSQIVEDEMDGAEEGNNPAIIAEKPIEIASLSVSDAVMSMDLQNLPALMFKNVKNGRVNLVYYRKDGNISWVDTAIEGK